MGRVGDIGTVEDKASAVGRVAAATTETLFTETTGRGFSGRTPPPWIVKVGLWSWLSGPRCFPQA